MNLFQGELLSKRGERETHQHVEWKKFIEKWPTSRSKLKFAGRIHLLAWHKSSVVSGLDCGCDSCALIGISGGISLCTVLGVTIPGLCHKGGRSMTFENKSKTGVLELVVRVQRIVAVDDAHFALWVTQLATHTVVERGSGERSLAPDHVGLQTHHFFRISVVNDVLRNKSCCGPFGWKDRTNLL